MDYFSCPIEHVDYAVIPAYEPDERLVALSNALHDMACKLIVVMMAAAHPARRYGTR